MNAPTASPTVSTRNNAAIGKARNTVVLKGFSMKIPLNELTRTAELRNNCPVARNENYRGFWFLTSYEAVSQTPRENETFARKYEPTPQTASTT